MSHDALGFAAFPMGTLPRGDVTTRLPQEGALKAALRPSYLRRFFLAGSDLFCAPFLQFCGARFLRSGCGFKEVLVRYLFARVQGNRKLKLLKNKLKD